MILNVAIRDGVLRTNPCTGAMKELKRKYAGTKKDVKALTKAEQEVFEDFLSKPGIFHCLYPLITVMLYTGIRVGELGAMRWADVDFEKNVIEISHTLVFDESTDHKGSVFTLNPPKTGLKKGIISFLFTAMSPIPTTFSSIFRRTTTKTFIMR